MGVTGVVFRLWSFRQATATHSLLMISPHPSIAVGPTEVGAIHEFSVWFATKTVCVNLRQPVDGLILILRVLCTLLCTKRGISLCSYQHCYNVINIQYEFTLGVTETV